ncbi:MULTISPECIES: hypothetical protein [unclassified Microbacterium]|uniref:hypothetical protein n=1 Tax=unclassified Microbacterium TaxID=2609290 RepID=UPI00214C3E5B|nr:MULTISPECIES: hypothetical protein [unclassified Microbacterium]MCR2783962.1 hypothetical protein [Microbacterium sp. zg.B96]WIM15194.1 hypothetical protein QNO11_11660 [Microbacterium sp. zg-B96]
MAHRPSRRPLPTTRARAIVAAVLAASVAASGMLVACTPRIRAPATPTATVTPTPTTPAPRPDATIPESPDSADAALSCTDDLAAWILGESGLIADERVATPAPSDPTVDFTRLAAPACAFRGTHRSFTDIDELEATSDVRAWVLPDAAAAAAHADAAIAVLEAAGYTTTSRKDGTDPAAHLLRVVGTEVADESVVLTRDHVPSVRGLGADAGPVAVVVGVVTFATVG